MPTPRQNLTGRVESIEYKVDVIAAKTDAVVEKVDAWASQTAQAVTRLDKIDLNGHGPAIKRLAEAAPKLEQLADLAPRLEQLAEVAPKLDKLAEASDELLGYAQRREDWQSVGDIMKRFGLSKTFALLFAGFIGAICWTLGSRWIIDILSHFHAAGF